MNWSAFWEFIGKVGLSIGGLALVCGFVITIILADDDTLPWWVPILYVLVLILAIATIIGFNVKG